MPKSPCRFLVPTHYNDGRPVEPSVMLEIHNEIKAEFGAYRIVNHSEGCWEGQTEMTIEYEVAVPVKWIPKLRKLVQNIGRKLGQRAMYFDAPPPTTEIIDTETGEEYEEQYEDVE